MKRARRRTLQEDLRRHAKRIQAPYMRDGKLTSREKRYAEGDNTVIVEELIERLATKEALDAVSAADAGGTDAIPISMPTWLWRALFRAIAQATTMEIDSWDEVFGAPVLTKDRKPARGKTRLALRRKAVLQFDIYNRVQQLTAGGEAAVDKKLFERIAKEHGIGRAMAEEIYYEGRAMAELVTCSLRGQSLRD